MSFQKLSFTKKEKLEIINKSKNLLDEMKTRRTVRDFSNEQIPLEAGRKNFARMGCHSRFSNFPIESFYSRESE